TLGTIGPENPVDSLVVAVGHNEYRHLTPAELASYLKPGVRGVLADIKSLYNRHDLAATGFDVFRF
ncbi:MAG: Vi polysaccharide biosynthesis UDP-N-acetylglucosamine C-6 dehydrogenase TviB, partial [Rhodoferax sp.]|nr:Vi polysaccharide biosynthesis UDP-N-acetylglucosamine C-6 dehydrogenase TviB [Rhodoferax sp.]